MTDYQVVLYGAGGFTGKLVAWHLAELGVPFIAAGRNKDTLAMEMKRVPELEGHDYEVVEAKLDRQVLAELFKGKTVVYNFVGPFMQLSEPVVQAALDAGVHYMDSTGETDWMTMLRDKYGPEFEKKDLLLAPASSYMWSSGAIASEIVLETPGVDTLEILYIGNSNTSEASTASFLRMCTNPQYYLQNNEMVMWPYATDYTVQVPHMMETGQALPWSGGGEPIWYQHDDRVRNVKCLTAFVGNPVYPLVIGYLKQFEEEVRDKPHAEREAWTNALGATLVTEEPDRENAIENRCHMSVIGRGALTAVKLNLIGNCGYNQTAIIAAEGMRRILGGQLLEAGFQSAARAFGARNLLHSMAEFGYSTADINVQKI